MALQNVDVIELQPLQARLHGVEDMLAVQPLLVDDASHRLLVEDGVRAKIGRDGEVELMCDTTTVRQGYQAR